MSKDLAYVNGFKVTPDWYAAVQRIATERHTTIGGAIQIVFNLGLPIYERIRTYERETIEQAYRDLGESKPLKRGAGHR